MIVIYLFILSALRLGVFVGKFFIPKARLLANGQKDIFKKLREAFTDKTQKIIWIHCASLGEFEQGRPLIERFKKEYPAYKILLTFFSPSGYEVRKEYQHADYVFYLPLESPTNAKKFVSITNPSLAFFIKYEFWYFYCSELKKRNIPILSVSSIFRKNQLFFKPYGKFYRSILFKFSHFFVQDQKSVNLLKEIQIENCSLAGDTRFDRVHQMVSQRKNDPLVEKFKSENKVFVIGSCWPEDMDVLIPFINENYYQLKFIIAPHEISEPFLKEIEAALQVRSIRYSKIKENTPIDECQTLIIDNVGMLSSLYYYGEFAYVGGGFGKGLHNILEAACYGLPIFFGNKNYKKFKEAVELIMRGGAFEISDYPDLKANYNLINTPESFLLACEVTKLYIEENLGATDKIMHFCKKYLN